METAVPLGGTVLEVILPWNGVVILVSAGLWVVVVTLGAGATFSPGVRLILILQSLLQESQSQGSL